MNENSKQTIDSIKQVIVHLLEKRGALPHNNDNYQYFETGHIDSIGLIKFIIELEDTFQVTIFDDDISSENFKTPKGLSIIVLSKLTNSDVYRDH